MRGLIKFDLTGIPAGSTITSAKLCLYSSSEAIVTGDTGYYGAYRVTTAWTESGSTWNSSDTGVPWTSPGGDFEATPDATSPKQAVAITSLAESLTCVVGLIAYILMRGNIDFTLAIPLTCGAMLSVPMATLTVRKLPEYVMRTSVGVTTCLLGLFTLVKLFW